MNIHISIDADSAEQARDEMAKLLRGHPAVVGSEQPLDFEDSVRDEPKQPAEEDPAQVLAETNFAPTGAAKPTRERGKPSPGHARRTKTEIAEDDAFLAGANTELQALKPEADAPVETVVEDSPEVQAADAADEAAETAAAKAPDATPTLEDIRNVLGTYVKVYGMDAAMDDGPIVISEICGEGVVKVSSVPENKIADVIAALKKAGNENRFGRTAVAS